MAQSTEFRDETFPRTDARLGEGAFERLWGKVKNVIVRCIFWAYERGSWQYDIIVLAILAFILLTPRNWFNDRPTLQLTDLRHQQGVVEMSHGKEGWRYLVDARLVESFESQKPEDAIQQILGSRLQKPFTVKSIVPVRDKNNVVLGYTVMITR